MSLSRNRRRVSVNGALLSRGQTLVFQQQQKAKECFTRSDGTTLCKNKQPRTLTDKLLFRSKSEFVEPNKIIPTKKQELQALQEIDPKCFIAKDGTKVCKDDKGRNVNITSGRTAGKLHFGILEEKALALVNKIEAIGKNPVKATVQLKDGFIELVLTNENKFRAAAVLGDALSLGLLTVGSIVLATTAATGVGAAVGGGLIAAGTGVGLVSRGITKLTDVAVGTVRQIQQLEAAVEVARQSLVIPEDRQALIDEHNTEITKRQNELVGQLKTELTARAQELELKGTSLMTKTDLAREIAIQEIIGNAGKDIVEPRVGRSLFETNKKFITQITDKQISDNDKVSQIKTLLGVDEDEARNIVRREQLQAMLDAEIAKEEATRLSREADIQRAIELEKVDIISKDIDRIETDPGLLGDVVVRGGKLTEEQKADELEKVFGESELTAFQERKIDQLQATLDIDREEATDLFRQSETAKAKKAQEKIDADKEDAKDPSGEKRKAVKKSLDEQEKAEKDAEKLVAGDLAKERKKAEAVVEKQRKLDEARQLKKEKIQSLLGVGQAQAEQLLVEQEQREEQARQERERRSFLGEERVKEQKAREARFDRKQKIKELLGVNEIVAEQLLAEQEKKEAEAKRVKDEEKATKEATKVAALKKELSTILEGKEFQDRVNQLLEEQRQRDEPVDLEAIIDAFTDDEDDEETITETITLADGTIQTINVKRRSQEEEDEEKKSETDDEDETPKGPPPSGDDAPLPVGIDTAPLGTSMKSPQQKQKEEGRPIISNIVSTFDKKRQQFISPDLLKKLDELELPSPAKPEQPFVGGQITPTLGTPQVQTQLTPKFNFEPRSPLIPEDDPTRQFISPDLRTNIDTPTVGQPIITDITPPPPPFNFTQISNSDLLALTTRRAMQAAHKEQKPADETRERYLVNNFYTQGKFFSTPSKITPAMFQSGNLPVDSVGNALRGHPLAAALTAETTDLDNINIYQTIQRQITLAASDAECRAFLTANADLIAMLPPNLQNELEAYCREVLDDDVIEPESGDEVEDE